MHKRTVDPDFKSLAACQDCTLNKQVYVPWDLKLLNQHPVLYVGRDPGMKTEIYTGIPFTGTAGKMLWAVMNNANLDKALASLTNITACNTPEDRGPTLREINNCFERMKAEIHHAQPKLIIAMGEEAIKALTNKGQPTVNKGEVVPLLDKFNYKCPVLLQLHPSFVQRTRQWIPVAVDVFKLVPSILDGSYAKDTSEEFLSNPNALQLATYLKDPGIYAVDTETTGLNPRKDTIIGHSFSKGDGNTAAAIVYDGPHDKRWPVVRKFFEDEERLKVWQNGPFDLYFNQMNDLSTNGWYYDTLLAQQMRYSDLPGNLDFLRSQYTTIPPYKPSKREIANMSNWGIEKVTKYANLDAKTTMKVFLKQREVMTPAMINLMQNHLFPLTFATIYMTNIGMNVDINKLAALYARIQPELEEMAKPFKKLNLNPNSPQQMAKYLFQKKDASTDKRVLEKLILRGHPKAALMEQLLAYKRKAKIAGTYLRGVYNRLEDGRIHTQYRIDGTATGRLSSKDPNLQNVPEEMREIYIPDPDSILLAADYRQVELWVGAILAHEDKMLKDLQDGRNIHMAIAERCYPDVKEISHQQYLRTKAIVFGTFYGRGARSIAIEFGVSTHVAQQWQNICIKQYPGLLRYQEDIKEQVKTKGYLETPFGRRRYVTSLAQGMNFPMQSTAGDITLGAVWRAHQDDLDIRLSVHDENVLNVPKDQFDDHLIRFKKTMERPIPELENICFRVDYETGMDWYHMEKMK